MKKSYPDFAFKRYSGKRCHNQETLTRYYVQLHDEHPTVNCIMSYGGSNELAVFDGNHSSTITAEKDRRFLSFMTCDQFQESV
ncbi:MAG: hypothetical protein K9L59_03580 [Desulfobacterales bacterium]|nr:hypothetical protein [Desulfobacterales bacterium]